MIRRPLRTAPRRAHPSAALVTALVAGAALAAVASAASPSPEPTARPGLPDGEAWIAYQTITPERAGNHAVNLIRTDGTGAFFAFDMIPGGEQKHPDWSPDGRHVVIDALDATSTSDIWIVDVTDWSAEEVVDCVAPCLWAEEPAWSPDGTKIAYQRHTQTDAGEISTIEILDTATGATTTVYTTGPAVQAYAPRWSPDGGSLVLEMPAFSTSGEVLGSSLGILDLSAVPPSVRTVVPADLLANNPDWSPDGTLIAFSAPITGGEPGGSLSDIWVVSPDGTGLRQVTDVAAIRRQCRAADLHA